MIDPISGGYGPGLAPGGLGHWAGALGQKVKDGFGSVFANAQVADGVRGLIGGIRGGDPLVGVHPGLDPGLAPELPAGPAYRGVLRGDWDANAWRSAGRFADSGARFDPGMSRYADPGIGRYADPGMSRYADPSMGRYADPGMPRYGAGRYADPGVGRYGEPRWDPYADPAAGATPWRQSLSQIGRGMLSGAKSGAIFSGVISLLVNGYKVIRGREAVSGAAGSVVADTASGAVSGATGALASGVALAVATTFGMTVGLPLTILGIAAGLGGAMLGSWVFKRTGAYGGIKNGVTRLLGGSALGSSLGRDVPIHSPGGSLLGMPSSNVGGLVPVNPNLGRLVPLR
ncbi:MAG: hypothetical protein FJZ01_07985 [Candidatus Sericytochromatia bacterium]|nr:hypothetical protein [Candidatus Tanganyikabacteria bacterium]